MSEETQTNTQEAPAAEKPKGLSWAKCGKQNLPRRTVIHGVHGVGKTSFAIKSRNCIVIRTEDGCGDFDVAYSPMVKSFEHLLELLTDLGRNEHGFETVIIDSLSALEPLIHKFVCENQTNDKGQRVKSIESFGYGKGWLHAMELGWRPLMAYLNALRSKRKMGIILIAHTDVVRFDDPTSAPYERYKPAINKLAAAEIMQWADEVLFATWKTYTTTVTDEKRDMKLTKGSGDGERVIYTTERPAWMAKNRLSLPDEISLDWDAYAAHFPK